jgi:putative Mg2+ transporter-C (MgtC) family protein
MVLAAALEVLNQEFGDLADPQESIRIALRIVAALALGGVLGWEREHEHKPAGVRTHMLVALGAAVLVLVPQRTGMSSADLSRIIQGIVTGIGFIGGGAILKLGEEKMVRGLTTAAGLWATTAVGIAVGLGRLWSACAVALAAFVVLSVLGWIEYRLLKKRPP